MKSQLIVLDILAHNDWKRPIYFVTGYHGDALGLEEYFQLEGLAYRFVPIKSQNNSWVDYGRIDPDILYPNMMKKFVWGGANDPKVDIDYNHKRTMLVVRARLNYAKLANALVRQGKNEKATEVLDYCMKALPLETIPYDTYVPDIIEAYFNSGNKEKALKMSHDICNFSYTELGYWLKQRPYIVSSADYQVRSAFDYLSRISNACMQAGETDFAKEIYKKLEEYYAVYVNSQKSKGK
jgi:tetratricopeptide (TPR) repeat protein